MARRTLVLTPEGDAALESYKKEHPKLSYGDILSLAIRNFAVWEQRDYAKNMIENTVKTVLERRVGRMENGLRAMLASSMIDTCMMLADTIEARALEKGVAPSADYEDLRRAGLALFNRKRFPQDGQEKKSE